MPVALAGGGLRQILFLKRYDNRCCPSPTTAVSQPSNLTVVPLLEVITPFTPSMFDILAFIDYSCKRDNMEVVPIAWGGKKTGNYREIQTL